MLSERMTDDELWQGLQGTRIHFAIKKEDGQVSDVNNNNNNNNDLISKALFHQARASKALWGKNHFEQFWLK